MIAFSLCRPKIRGIHGHSSPEFWVAGITGEALVLGPHFSTNSCTERAMKRRYSMVRGCSNQGVLLLGRDGAALGPPRRLWAVTFREIIREYSCLIRSSGGEQRGRAIARLTLPYPCRAVIPTVRRRTFPTSISRRFPWSTRVSKIGNIGNHGFAQYTRLAGRFENEETPDRSA